MLTAVSFRASFFPSQDNVPISTLSTSLLHSLSSLTLHQGTLQAEDAAGKEMKGPPVFDSSR